MKSPKSKNLKAMQEAGINVPPFFVIEPTDTVLAASGKYAVRSAPYISMAGVLNSVLDVDGENLPTVVAEVFASWNSDLARKYRDFKKISYDVAMEVIVQNIVSPLGGYAGIAHTCDPVRGWLGMDGVFVEGEFANELCEGKISGTDCVEKAFPSRLYGKLMTLCQQVEKYYGFPQDIEWVIDVNEKIWLVQTRPAQLTDYAFFSWVFWQEDVRGVLYQYGAAYNIEKCVELVSSDTKPIGKCVGVSGDTIQGEIGKDVLVLDGGIISEFPKMLAAQNIILRSGNEHNHFAVEARKIGKNCVIWSNVPESGYIWIDVKSGCVFDAPPSNAVFENKLQKKFAAMGIYL